MDTLVAVFLPITEAITLPLVVLCFIFGSKLSGTGKTVARFFTVLALLLYIAATLNLLIGNSNSGYYTNGWGNFMYVYYYRHPCVWVGMGLAIGALVVSIVTLFSTIAILRRRPSHQTYIRVHSQKPTFKNYYPTNNEPVTNEKKEPSNSSYILEIKELYELLSCGAITQEEYDKKKAEILNR